MEEMDCHCSVGDSGDPGIYRHRRRNSAAPVELATAAALRLAPGYLLASAGDSGAVPNLFGGFGTRGSGRSGFRRRMEERCEHMTPEERERFRQRMGERFGFGPSA